MWLAIYCPYLDFDALVLAQDELPYVIVDNHRPRIIKINKAAETFGLKENMTLSQAYMLCPNLEVIYSRKESSLALQETLAQALGELSATVCIASRDTITLEIATMMKYFGGIQPIIDEVNRLMQAWITDHQIPYIIISSMACLCRQSILLKTR